MFGSVWMGEKGSALPFDDAFRTKSRIGRAQKCLSNPRAPVTHPQVVGVGAFGGLTAF